MREQAAFVLFTDCLFMIGNALCSPTAIGLLIRQLEGEGYIRDSVLLLWGFLSSPLLVVSDFLPTDSFAFP